MSWDTKSYASASHPAYETQASQDHADISQIIPTTTQSIWDKEMLSSETLNDLHQLLSEQIDGHFTIEINSSPFNMHDLKTQAFKLENLSIANNHSKFSVILNVICKNKSQKKYPIQGKIVHHSLVPALNHTVKPGEIIQEEDIHFIAVPSKQINNQTIIDISELIGTAPKQNYLKINTAISKNDVYKPSIVFKGELVTISATTDDLVITTKGKALENGSLGQVIRLVNLKSNRTIHATITAPKHAEIQILAS